MKDEGSDRKLYTNFCQKIEKNKNLMWKPNEELKNIVGRWSKCDFSC